MLWEGRNAFSVHICVGLLLDHGGDSLAAVGNAVCGLGEQGSKARIQVLDDFPYFVLP
jgi:hypothetical protein